MVRWFCSTWKHCCRAVRGTEKDSNFVKTKKKKSCVFVIFSFFFLFMFIHNLDVTCLHRANEPGQFFPVQPSTPPFFEKKTKPWGTEEWVSHKSLALQVVVFFFIFSINVFYTYDPERRASTNRKWMDRRLLKSAKFPITDSLRSPFALWEASAI